MSTPGPFTVTSEGPFGRTSIGKGLQGRASKVDMAGIYTDWILGVLGVMDYKVTVFSSLAKVYFSSEAMTLEKPVPGAKLFSTSVQKDTCGKLILVLVWECPLEVKS